MPDMASWSVRNLRFDAGVVSTPPPSLEPQPCDANGRRVQAALDAGPGVLDKAGAFALVSSNVEKLLGLGLDAREQDLVATVGGDLLDFAGKVVAVISPRQEAVDIFV